MLLHLSHVAARIDVARLLKAERVTMSPARFREGFSRIAPVLQRGRDAAGQRLKSSAPRKKIKAQLVTWKTQQR